MIFADRTDAGRRLAQRLAADEAGRRTDLVLGLPRGGIPVAAPVASAFGARLAPLVVAKIRAPGRPELAIGAVAELGGQVHTFRNDDLLRRLGVSASGFERLADAARSSLGADYGPTPAVSGRHVAVIDDGLATGATMAAALTVLRKLHPAFITVAVPVASEPAVTAVEALADHMVSLDVPRDFRAVGLAYEDFDQTPTAEVRRILVEAASGQTSGPNPYGLGPGDRR